MTAMNLRIKLFPIILFFITFHSMAQSQLPPGYPDQSSSLDVLPGFVHPPKGYGEVPFFWWQGDSLTRERLLWQLNQLQNKGISSLQINYSHRDFGGISYGLSNPSKPALFTEEWWKLFKWFAGEAHSRGMTVSLSDYTIGVGQGFAMDEALRDHPELNGSQLKKYTKVVTGKAEFKVPGNLITCTAVKMNADSSLIPDTRKSMLEQVKDQTLKADFGRETWKLTGVYAEKLIPSYDPMNPISGKAYNDYFFGKFEQALPFHGAGMLNFFFSDELNFRVNGNIWNDQFASEFKKRKGYDVTPFLDALYENIGNITPKIRIDYNDVVVALSEENFFKPVYQWHQDRGLIFGCDHGGRGREVAEFGDYFRTQRWNQGPGSDQPQLSKDIIKAKVASSISHLYHRPRVWLEGFHSSGWSTSSADVTDAILANFVAGYNLLSFHGLYYSTMGGWWEWAPPCNHFRMPYWQQIGPLMNGVERLSYLLSQGVHRCDVAIVYPTEPVVAGMDGEQAVQTAFTIGEKLYNSAIDFDFIDFESLARCKVNDAALHVAGEEYKVLIVPSMKVMRETSLQKIEEFKQAGGIVVAVGSIPQATDQGAVSNDATVRRLSEIFSEKQGLVLCRDYESVIPSISAKFIPHFRMLTVQKERPYVMHRVIGKRDVFALYNFRQGSKCFFKAKGDVQLWNPWTGVTSSISSFARPVAEGTEVTLPLTFSDIQIIVFDQDHTPCKNELRPQKITRQIAIDNSWEFELKPSLDNQWGDFQLPAKNELLGAQVRQMYFSENTSYAGGKIEINQSWKNITCGFGPRFLKLGAMSQIPAKNELQNMKLPQPGDPMELDGKKYFWKAYAFSWQQGVEGDYGHQGYHGLKGTMYDNFIRLGALSEEKMSLFRTKEPEGNFYILMTNVIAPEQGVFDLMTGEVKPLYLFVNHQNVDGSSRAVSLKKGENLVLAVYDKACETYLVFRQPSVARPAKQPVSMCWYGDPGVLLFGVSSSAKNGLFVFDSAPGLRAFSFEAYGKPEVWADGIKQNPESENRFPDGLIQYRVAIKDPKPNPVQIVLRVQYQSGREGAGAFPKYIEQDCGQGRVTLGDWSLIDGLKAYSGGAWYRKNVHLGSADLNGKLELDLGDLVSSAELMVNGKSAGIRLAPPWTFDITSLAKEGENGLEVLVYNTLVNNYTTIPTRYLGSVKSGLFGPVMLNILQ